MTAAQPTDSKPLLVSFSGIDGAGKSTHIECLRSTLAAAGCPVTQFAFWDDVVVLSHFREGVTHKVFKSEKGIGAPGKPVQRRDKNVRAWYLSLFRSALYLLDAMHLRRVVNRARRSGAAVIIFDRYIYDELANLPLERRMGRAFLRAVAWLCPSPDIAYVIDAKPEEACARKPEYPLEFSRRCRDTYLRLAGMLHMSVVPPLALAEAQHEMLNRFQQVVEARRPLLAERVIAGARLCA
ncbi:MAG TPA: thymidylate kinase [Terriglobales bacterium]|nr:thymidylate kinase [Terriglobales bacterium]